MHFYSKNSRLFFGKNRTGAMSGQAVRNRGEAGFVLTLTEVLISVVIVAIVFGTIINGYLIGAKRLEWSGYSLAAQSSGLEVVEQARAAVWDISIGKNELTNITLLNRNYNVTTATLTGYQTNIMDIPWKGNNYTIATNFIFIQTIYENNNSNVPVQIQVLRVDTVWPYTGWGNFARRYYTNSICTFIAPDNRGL